MRSLGEDLWVISKLAWCPPGMPGVTVQLGELAIKMLGKGIKAGRAAKSISLPVGGQAEAWPGHVQSSAVVSRSLPTWILADVPGLRLMEMPGPW